MKTISCFFFGHDFHKDDHLGLEDICLLCTKCGMYVLVTLERL